MSDKVICKYKFQDKEKFFGKEYCTLFNEVCSDIKFVCDKNCQVYEDYKQLKRLKAENETMQNAIEKCVENAGVECDDEEQAINSLSRIGSTMFNSLMRNEELKQTLEEIREVVGTNRSFEELLNYSNDININKIDKVIKVINEVLK